MNVTNKLTRQISKPSLTTSNRKITNKKFNTSQNSKQTRITNTFKQNFTSKLKNQEPQKIYQKIVLNENHNKQNFIIPSYVQKMSSQINLINSLYRDLIFKATINKFALESNQRLMLLIKKDIQQIAKCKQKANENYQKMIQTLKLAQIFQKQPQKLINSDIIFNFFNQINVIEFENKRLRQELHKIIDQKQSIQLLPIEDQQLQKKHLLVNKAIEKQKKLYQKVKKQEQNMTIKLRGTLKSQLKYDRSTNNLLMYLQILCRKYVDLIGFESSQQINKLSKTQKKKNLSTQK